MSRAVVLAAVQQRLVRTEDLRDAMSRRGPSRHRALILESIIDAEGGIHSVPEGDFSLIVRTRGLPIPTCQRILKRPDGRYYLDAEWEDLGVAAEVHGAHHREAGQWERDLTRHNHVTATGRRLLHFTSYAVRHQPQIVGDLLARTLRFAGLAA